MLLNIYNLPLHMRYADVKSLIFSKCGLKEVILDNLVNEGSSKKVTVGLAEEEDAAILVRQINGLYLEGKQLFVENVRQNKPTEQPYRQSNRNESSNIVTQRNYNQQNYASQQAYSQQINTANTQQAQYLNHTAGNQMNNVSGQQPINPEQFMSMMMPYMAGMNMGGMYYMPQAVQNAYTDYASQTQLQQSQPTASQYPQFSGQQEPTGSETSRQPPHEDLWSSKRRAQLVASQDDDTGYGNEYSYKSNTRQQSGHWSRGSDVDKSGRRSRSTDRKRERSRGRSRSSPKRARKENNRSRDSSRNTDSHSYRNSQKDQYDRHETYTSQTYTSQTYGNSANKNTYTQQTYDNSANNSPTSQTFGNSDYNNTYTSQSHGNSGNNNPYTSQSYGSSGYDNPNTSQSYGNSGYNNPYTPQSYGNSDENNYTSNSNKNAMSYYHNKPVTAPSANDQPKPLLGLRDQGQWNQGTRNRTWQRQDETNMSNWNEKDSSGPLSNYRKHMDTKAAPSKSWNNTAQTIRDPKDTVSYGKSRDNWRKGDSGSNETKTSRWGGQANPSYKAKPLLADQPGPDQKSPNFDDRTSFGRDDPKRNPSRKPQKSNRRVPVMPSIKQDFALRFKAAEVIAKRIAKANKRIINEGCMEHLKQSVRSRLEILLTATLGESIRQMISLYRSRFPIGQDPEFCKLIAEEALAQSKTAVDLTEPNVKAGVTTQENPSPQVDKNQPAVSKTQPITGKSQPKAGGSQPKASQPVVPRLQLQKPDGKLPKYPNSDKQVYKDQKKVKKLEHSNEDLYSLPTHMNDALEEELNNISDIFKSVVSKPDSEQEKDLCERLLDVGLEQVRKVVKLYVTKRILNITTGLIIRVLVTGKAPKKAEVELYMRKWKVVSMKKSDRKKLIYVATCKDFDTYDQLLEMGSVSLNPETILRFKPFQIAGPKLSFRERKQLQEQRFVGQGNPANKPTGSYQNITNDVQVQQGPENYEDFGNADALDQGGVVTLDQGNDEALDQGNNVALDQGNNEALDQGNNVALDQGNNEALDRGNDEALDQGNDEALDQGNDEALDQGNDAALDQGNDAALDQGNDEALDQGHDDEEAIASNEGINQSDVANDVETSQTQDGGEEETQGQDDDDDYEIAEDIEDVELNEDDLEDY